MFEESQISNRRAWKTTNELSNSTLKSNCITRGVANDFLVQNNLKLADNPLIDDMDAPLYRRCVETELRVVIGMP